MRAQMSHKPTMVKFIPNDTTQQYNRNHARLLCRLFTFSSWRTEVKETFNHTSVLAEVGARFRNIAVANNNLIPDIPKKVFYFPVPG